MVDKRQGQVAEAGYCLRQTTTFKSNFFVLIIIVDLCKHFESGRNYRYVFFLIQGIKKSDN